MAGSNMVTVQAAPIWPLLRDGVIRLVDEMKIGRYNVGITYDPGLGLFTITCRAEDEEGVIEYFEETYSIIEQDIEDNEEGIFFETDGVLLGCLPDNPWITRERNTEQTRDIIRASDKYRFPTSFPNAPFRGVWTRLDHFHWLVLKDIVGPQQLDHLSNEYNATIETDICGVEVYLGAQHQHDLKQLFATLDHLLYLKCVRDPTPAHIFYTENHKDPEGIEITIDARFMANIDLGLLRTTLLDMSAATDPNVDYHALANGVTLRLCQWDSSRGYATSYFGPPVRPRRGSASANIKRFVFRNNNGARIGPSYSSVGVVLEQGKKAIQVSGPLRTDTSLPSVEKWLDTVEEIPDEFASIVTSSSATYSVNGGDSASKLPAILQDLLIDLSTADDVPPSEVPQKQTRAELDGLIFDNNGLAASVTSVPVTGATTTDHGHGEYPGVRASTTTDSMSAVSGSRSDLYDDSTDTELVFTVGKQYVGRRKEPVSPRSNSQHSITLARNIPPSVSGSSVKGSSTTSTSRRAGKHKAAELSREIHAAVRQLLKKGPYMRGQVSLRFDLGRIVIAGMDYSGLSFNPPGFRSNGWRKSLLLRNFHHAGNQQRLLFTPILTQDGSDIDFLIKTTDSEHRKPMWKDEATETKTYSFYCRDEDTSDTKYFCIDVVPKEDGGFAYRLHTDQDEKGPVWIHGVLRNWDARIVMSYANTSALEAKYGTFAKMLVNGTKIDQTLIDKPKYHVCVASTFGKDVELLGMRTHTTWRFPSVDGQSYLNITEVEQMAKGALSCTDSFYHYEFESVPEPHDLNHLKAMGQPSLWYQASITSITAEKLLAENEVIGFGEKVHWDYDVLKKEKVVEALYKPGLRMLQLMDSVGAHNDNHQVETMNLPQKNFGPYTQVPGANYVQPSSSTASAVVSEPVTPNISEEAGLMAPPPGSVRGSVHIQQQRRRAARPPSVAPSAQQTGSTMSSSRLPGPSFW